MSLSIEKRLVELVNEERERNKLSILVRSPQLTELARAHSRDMAERKTLSHESTPGKPFSQRIVDAGFFFYKCGENIAFSESHVPEMIHQALLDSPEHREEILTLDYNQLGVGVVYVEKKGFYVTQHFIRALVPLNEKDAEERLKKNINSGREAAGVPPFSFSSKAEDLARTFSKNKAAELPLPRVGDVLGETLIETFTTASLGMDVVLTENNQSLKFEDAALGVWFGRSASNPGGAFFITIFLFPKDVPAWKKPEELRIEIHKAINAARRTAQLDPLYLNNELSEKAEKTSQGMSEGKSLSAANAASLMQVKGTICYQTENPASLPDSALARLKTPDLKTVGVGIVLDKTSGTRRGVYWVTLFFR